MATVRSSSSQPAITHRVTCLLAAAALLLAPVVARAEVVHESGTSTGPSSGGFTLGGGDGYQWGSRFHLDVTTEIQSGGGRVNGSAPNLRVSIVALSPPAPPATPSTFTPLVSAIVPAPGGDVDLLAPLPVTLPPGDYAILLNNVDPAGDGITMPFENTANPEASFFQGRTSPDAWSDDLGVLPGFYPRFFVYNGCGNGALGSNEECDDGNTADNDGCDSLCREDNCGDGILDLNEECDDGNTADNDCCDQYCDFPSVDTCVGAGAGSLTFIFGDTEAKDKLVWKWAKGDAVDLADFGDPSATTSLHLCLEQPSPARRVFGDIAMAPDAAWSSNEKLWKLKAKTPSPGLSGIASGSLKPGAAGKSSIKLIGSGENLPSLSFVSSAHPLTATLRASNGKCWTSGAMDVLKSSDTKILSKLQP